MSKVVMPTVGRVVHLYTGGDGPMPALVCDVSRDPESTMVAVAAFRRSGVGPLSFQGVKHESAPTRVVPSESRMYWCWPPRAEPEAEAVPELVAAAGMASEPRGEIAPADRCGCAHYEPDGSRKRCTLHLRHAGFCVFEESEPDPMRMFCGAQDPAHEELRCMRTPDHCGDHNSSLMNRPGHQWPQEAQ